MRWRRNRTSGAHLTKLVWTPIVRHQMVDSFASPDDPKLADYWTARKRRSPPLNRDGRRLIARQHGRCPACGNPLLPGDEDPQHPDQWEQWITATRKAVRVTAITVHSGHRPDDRTVLHLLHADCARRHVRRRSPALLPTHDPSGLA